MQQMSSFVAAVEGLVQGSMAMLSPTASRDTGFFASSGGYPRGHGSSVEQQAKQAAEEEMVLYKTLASGNEQSIAPAGLGSIQPNGRNEVLQDWLCAGRRDPSVPRPSSLLARAGDARSAIRVAQGPAAASATNINSVSSAPTGGDAGGELAWSCLGDAAKQALKQWVMGQLGGRHCMLILEHSSGSETAAASFGGGVDALPAADLRGWAALNVLSGLQAEVELLDGQHAGGWLFKAVFDKSPAQVLDEAIAAVREELNDTRFDNPGSVSAEQASLALRRRAMRLQCSLPRHATDGSGARYGDEHTRVQVWLELLRLHVESHGGMSIALKDRSAPKADRPQLWSDGSVIRDLGKNEQALEVESNAMSLEGLRAQNRAIEEYVMRLVRQRDELKHMMKVAEEHDAYVILGLEGPEATEGEVKKAYRELARKEHPDKAGIANKKKFQTIQQAYTSIMRHMRDGTSASRAGVGGTAEEEPEKAEREDKTTPVSASVAEANTQALHAKDAADRVAVCAHRTLQSNDDCGDAQNGVPKRRALRALRDLTKQSSSELRNAAEHLRELSAAVCGIARCAEEAMSAQQEWASTTVAGVGLRDRAVIVDDAGRSSLSAAELLDKISEATEATLKKVEKAGDGPPEGSARGPGRDEAAKLVALGVRLLSESMARTAVVARRSADEAINAASKAFELSRGLAALEAEARKEQDKAAAKQSSFDDDDILPAADGTSDADGAGSKDAPDGGSDRGASTCPEEAIPKSARTADGQPLPSPRDQLMSAAKRVKERHIALRVKNLRFLATLNEESLRLQGRLRNLLERGDGALLPEVTVGQKRQIFELVAQLLEFALSELARISTCVGVPPGKAMDRALSFALALEHAPRLAVPTEPRTQAMKLAALVDADLLCQILEGPFRLRLIAIGAKARRADANSAHNTGNRGVNGLTLRLRSSSLGGGTGKTWDEVAYACCARIVASVRGLISGTGAGDAPPAEDEDCDT